MQRYDRDCLLCRVMRAMAFSGLGAMIGGYGALLFDASKQTALMAAVVGASLVLGLTARAKR